MHPDELAEFFPHACPYRRCPSHVRGAEPATFTRRGLYATKLRDGSIRGHIPRFLCSSCHRSFSARRFAVEFRFRHPEVTRWMIEQFVSCVSIRQAGRHGILSRGAITRRLLRFGLHMHRLLRFLRRERLRGGRLPGCFLMDEAESFEGSRRLAPLTVPVVVEKETRYTVSFSVGPLAPRLPRTDPRRVEREAEVGVRVNRSRRVVTRCLRAMLDVAAPGSEFRTDMKPSYGAILARLGGSGQVIHRRTSSREPRGVRNPLFPINHTLAMVRDGLSRMRRRTWCTTKRRKGLWLHLAIYFAWKNLVRPRFNGERETPAQLAKVTDHRWKPHDLVRWRLDLGKASIAPLAE